LQIECQGTDPPKKDAYVFNLFNSEENKEGIYMSTGKLLKIFLIALAMKGVISQTFLML